MLDFYAFARGDDYLFHAAYLIGHASRKRAQHFRLQTFPVAISRFLPPYCAFLISRLMPYGTLFSAAAECCAPNTFAARSGADDRRRLFPKA